MLVGRTSSKGQGKSIHQKKTGNELKKKNVVSTYVLVDRFYKSSFAAHEQTHIACI